VCHIVKRKPRKIYRCTIYLSDIVIDMPKAIIMELVA